MRDELEAAIARNLDAGIVGPELDDAFAVLDAIDGDPDFASPDDEPDEFEEGCPESVVLLCVCSCGHRHTLPEDEWEHVA